jgi:hypothetical protein
MAGAPIKEPIVQHGYGWAAGWRGGGAGRYTFGVRCTKV